MYEDLVRTSHAVGQNSYHLIWKFKWARNPAKFLSVRNVVRAAIRRAACRHGMQIHELEVMEDHIHLFVSLPHTMSVANALRLLKGYTAKKTFEHQPWLRKYFRTGHLFSPGKFFRSVGSVTDTAIKNYIAQSNRGYKEQTSLLTRYPVL